MADPVFSPSPVSGKQATKEQPTSRWMQFLQSIYDVLPSPMVGIPPNSYWNVEPIVGSMQNAAALGLMQGGSSSPDVMRYYEWRGPRQTVMPEWMQPRAPEKANPKRSLQKDQP